MTEPRWRVVKLWWGPCGRCNHPCSHFFSHERDFGNEYAAAQYYAVNAAEGSSWGPGATRRLVSLQKLTWDGSRRDMPATWETVKEAEAGPAPAAQ